MKKILSLVLALALVLAASAAFADVPGNIKDIEGLPEMPEVPTMTTSVSGTTETIVVSEKLNWLNWINNWNWNQIEWSEDGLTGTFSLAGLKSQPGFGNYVSMQAPVEWWTYGDYVTDGEYEADNYVYKEPHTHMIHHEKVTPGEGFAVHYPNVKSDYWNDEDGFRHYYKYVSVADVTFVKDATYEEVEESIQAKRDAIKEEYPELADEVEYSGWATPVLEDESLVEWDDQYLWIGTYELGATVGNSDDFGRKNSPVYQGMAFDGEAANGAHVRYDRFGRVISITSTLTGVNFLNMENEPVKTEVTWGVSVTEYGRKFYIASIKAYIDDETAVEAGFASGGKLLKVK